MIDKETARTLEALSAGQLEDAKQALADAEQSLACAQQGAEDARDRLRDAGQRHGKLLILLDQKGRR